MKKFKLFKLLALLVVLLTSVSLVRANTYYYSGNGNYSSDINTWQLNQAMTVSADGYYEYYYISSNCTHRFKIGITNETYKYNYTYVSASYNSTNISEVGGYSSDACYCWKGSAHYILVYYPNTTVNITSNPIICAATYLPDNRSCTVYFINDDSWDGTIKAYGWYHKNNTDGSNNTWPGVAMTNTTKTYNGSAIWSYTFPQSYDMVIFNNKTNKDDSGHTQTANLGLTNAKDGQMWMQSNRTSTWTWITSYIYDVTATFNMKGHGDAVSSQTVLKGSTISEPDEPSATGYTFGGWYKETTCTNAWNFSTDVVNANTELFAKWTEKTYSITFTNDGHGSVSVGGSTISSGSSADVNHFTTKQLKATANNGYQFSSWSKSGTNTDKVTIADMTSTGATTTIVATATGATVAAAFSPRNYTITLNNHDADLETGTESVTATFNTNTNISSAITCPEKTGYTFDGYYTSTGGSGTKLINASGAWQTGNSYINGSGNWIWYSGDVELHANWTANEYSISIDNQTSAAGYYSAGDVSVGTATYDDDLPSITGTIPTAANGYKFVGFFTEELGKGEKLINVDKSWVNNVDGYTLSGNWVHAGNVTLYAYYQRANITSLTLTPSLVSDDGETITIMPEINPTPEGTITVSYELQYSNGTTHPSQPTFTPGVSYSATFTAPTTSATYRIQATLSTSGGAELHKTFATFQVAGQHDVTVLYKEDASGNTIKASDVIKDVEPLTWTTTPTTPPAITGFTFARWDAGDGVTLTDDDGSTTKTTTTTSSIKLKATYDGTLTAVYNKKDMIYFNNTLGWEDVWVYFYTSDKYWADNYGTGGYKGKKFDSKSPYWDMRHGHMTQIEGTNIWYFDYQAAGYGSYSTSVHQNVAFTNMEKSYTGTDDTSDNDKGYFSNTTLAPIQVVRRGDHGTARSLYVPLDETGTKMNNDKAEYYNNGFWMNYPESTGLVLKIYDGTGGGASLVTERKFEFSSDYAMPMSIDVDLEANHTYGFKLYRVDGNQYYGNNGTMKNGSSGDGAQTVWSFRTSYSNNCGLKTAGAGKYTFTLTYGYDAEYPAGYNYHIGVHYPIAVGDYRILYKDNANWSQTSAHGGSWWHESSVIPQNTSTSETKDDIVSLYVAYGSSPSAKFQYVSAINAETGAVTWTDVTGGTISLESITKAGVYNFNVRQTASGASISLVSTEAYTGNYYIRTDCAGGGKWDNYRGDANHLMTYSDYAAAKSASASNTGYTHYYAHWVTTGTNVKFVIANDYSQCISDTLSGDLGTVVATIDGSGFLSSGNASIRFMWNQVTNKLSRAYLSGSSYITDRFLVLEGDTKLFDENGTALTGVNRDHRTEDHKDGRGSLTYDIGEDNQLIFHDDQNFIYERTIKVQTTARGRVSAKYNDKVQYFIGNDEGATWAAKSEELLGGTDSETKHRMRVVYDFKTNRLIRAYVPDGEIAGTLAIHADIMLIREHQGEGQQLTFKDDKAQLTDVQTVYGVMRFNKYTLNNKDKETHNPLGDPKSAYERSLYWISFPFDVNLGDVFGFGTYGSHWIIEEYNGAKRAQEGYWADSDGFWEFVTNRNDKVLKAGVGYVLALDLDSFKLDNERTWANDIDNIELYFPSASSTVGSIKQTTADIDVPAHACTINRHTQAEKDAGEDTNINKNRTRADSHWNIIGVPSYANYGSELYYNAGTTSEITWSATPYTDDLPFLYEWNSVDNTYSVQSGTTYPFKTMHGYMVQYSGHMYWKLASAKPSSIAARMTEVPDKEYMLSLIKDSVEEDHTFVRMSDKEGVTAGFEFGQDLCKEYNGNKGNIYTFIDYLPVAGNSQPHPLMTTIVPVGVKIAANGEYTFSMPEGTNGGDVWLIDNANSSRTNLGLMDYTVNLTTGTYEGRFSLEFPVQNVVTEIENAANANANANANADAVRKVFVGGQLYIIRDGVIYNASGARVQ